MEKVEIEICFGLHGGTNSKLAELEASAVSKNTNGYIKFGGIIIQWGIASGTNWQKNVTFPVTFPIQCCSVVCSSQYPGASGKGYNNVTNITNVGCTLIIDNAPGCWLAVGY